MKFFLSGAVIVKDTERRSSRNAKSGNQENKVTKPYGLTLSREKRRQNDETDNTNTNENNPLSK